MSSLGDMFLCDVGHKINIVKSLVAQQLCKINISAWPKINIPKFLRTNTFGPRKNVVSQHFSRI